MKRRSTQPPRYLFLVLLLSLVPALLVPTASLAAKTPASEALAAAVASDSIDAVRQDLMMDFVQKQKYEFDEKGIEALGKGLCDQGKHKQGANETASPFTNYNNNRTDLLFTIRNGSKNRPGS